MFGQLNNDEIEELIKQKVVGRIGCHANGITYVVPVSYAYDGTYIYGHSFEGMKLNIMRKNPQVCFQVDDTRNLANWQSVICWGEFEELYTTVERESGLQKLVSRNLPIITSQTMHISAQSPFTPDNLDAIEGIVFRIRLKEKTGRFEKSSDDFFYAT